MEARYRVGLGELGLPLDAATFARDVTRLCSHRLFWMLSWNMRALLQRDRPVVKGEPGLRSVLLHHLAELLRLAHRASHARIDPELDAAIKLERLEHLHTFDVVAE